MNTYIIKKTSCPVTEESFNTANIANIDQVNWPNFGAPYKTEARILYSDEAFYVNLKTNEWPLTATHTKYNNEICEDSCMEFFFAPDADDNRYFNFEINPFGTFCLGIGKDRYDREEPDEEDVALFEVKSVITSGTWQIFYKIPFSFIKKYFKKIDVEMTGNLYKCGDKTPKVHYLTWNPVGSAEPDYHLSEFFGKFILEQ